LLQKVSREPARRNRVVTKHACDRRTELRELYGASMRRAVKIITNNRNLSMFG